MPIEHVPLTIANFADGQLVSEVDEKIAWCLNRFREAEDGNLELANDKATITLKLFIERDTKVKGFICSFEEPSVKLPAKVRSGSVAIERDGILVVSAERPSEQEPLIPLGARRNHNDSN